MKNGRDSMTKDGHIESRVVNLLFRSRPEPGVEGVWGQRAQPGSVGSTLYARW